MQKLVVAARRDVRHAFICDKSDMEAPRRPLSKKPTLPKGSGSFHVSLGEGNPTPWTSSSNQSRSKYPALNACALLYKFRVKLVFMSLSVLLSALSLERAQPARHLIARSIGWTCGCLARFLLHSRHTNRIHACKQASNT